MHYTDGLNFADYDDPHLNLFAPYGPHRYWENNVTSAIGKTLHYSSPALRKEFASEFLGVPSHLLTSDLKVWLQSQGHIDPYKAPCRFSLLLESPVDAEEEEISLESVDMKKTPRPDLWLVSSDGSLAILMEVKLWGGGGRWQHVKQARHFKAKSLGKKTFDDLYSWIGNMESSPNANRFLVQNLVGYLDDLALCERFNGFRKRDFAEDSLGGFRNYWLMRRKSIALAKELVLRNPDDVTTHLPERSGEPYYDFYVSFTPKNKSILGYFSFGFTSGQAAETDAAVANPCVFISGTSTKHGIEYSGRHGLDRMIRIHDESQERGRRSGFVRALQRLPAGGSLTLKTYTLRVRATENHKTRAVWEKTSVDQFEGPGGSTLTAEEVAHGVIDRAKRLHGKKLDNSRRQYAALVLHWKSLSLDDMISPRERSMDLFEIELREGVNLLQLTSS